MSLPWSPPTDTVDRTLSPVEGVSALDTKACDDVTNPEYDAFFFLAAVLLAVLQLFCRPKVQISMFIFLFVVFAGIG